MKHRTSKWLTVATIVWLFTSSFACAEEAASAIVLVGAGGEEEYAAAFAKWAGNWQRACDAGGVKARTIGLDESASKSLAQFRAALRDEPAEGAELWLVLIGHGVDGKFNLTGDDLSADEFATLLKPFHRPLVIINSFSASGAFMAPLAAPGRVIVCATKSASEHNYSRFGGYFSEAIADLGADLDKDGQTSVLEAWLAASLRVAAFYKDEGRLATEHSMLDDNGDGKGTAPDWFRGVRVVKKAKDGTPADGLRAHQIHLIANAGERALPPAVRAERDALEVELAKLRDTKSSMPEADYFRALEALLLKIAKLYDGHLQKHE